MTRKFELIGDEDLKRKLNQLGIRARSSLLKAAKAGAEVIREEANRRAPGPHIAIYDEKVQDSQAEVKIAPDREHWYYRFHETGASEHEIKASKAENLVFQGRSGMVMIKQVKHPGMSKAPFLRPALDQKKQDAVSAAGKIFRSEIDRLSDDQ